MIHRLTADETDPANLLTPIIKKRNRHIAARADLFKPWITRKQALDPLSDTIVALVNQLLTGNMVCEARRGLADFASVVNGYDHLAITVFPAPILIALGGLGRRDVDTRELTRGITESVEQLSACGLKNRGIDQLDPFELLTLDGGDALPAHLI